MAPLIIGLLVILVRSFSMNYAYDSIFFDKISPLNPASSGSGKGNLFGAAT